MSQQISGDLHRSGPARVGRGRQGQRPTPVPGQRRRRRRLDSYLARFGKVDATSFGCSRRYSTSDVGTPQTGLI
jgi:hypothetical protein